MASSEYYRRQSELCLQLALLRAELTADLHVTFWLLELAKELRAKAADAERELGSDATYEVTRGGRGRSPDRKLH
ncbi:MAG TPA: hypothetical protein VGI22_17215 [Xanthobacteraceae bacterium]|jgi:hypothetical protein